MAEDLRIPFIFIPTGDPPPYDWMRRHPDWIKIPALFVPHSWSESDRRAAVAAFHGRPAEDILGPEKERPPAIAVAGTATNPIHAADGKPATPPGGYVAVDP